MTSDEELFRTDNVVGVVEANSFETLMLWQEFKHHNWESQNIGTSALVGSVKINRKEWPVCISLTWISVYGYRVLLWDATSTVVHHEMIREWIAKNTPPGAIHTDAMNFANVIHLINRLRGE